MDHPPIAPTNPVPSMVRVLINRFLLNTFGGWVSSPEMDQLITDITTLGLFGQVPDDSVVIKTDDLLQIVRMDRDYVDEEVLYRAEELIAFGEWKQKRTVEKDGPS